MRNAIERMYASGELDRLLRFCGVKEGDIEDLRQEVAEILLTSSSKIQNLAAFTISVINRQYKSRKSRWWRKYGRWNATRNKLQSIESQIFAEGELGNMGGGRQAAEDVPCAGELKAERVNDFPVSAGAWHNSGSGKAVKGTSQHGTQDLLQDKSQDTK